MSFGKTISLYYATFLVLWLGGAVRLTESLEVIIRGHHDKFQNTECLETHSTTGTDGPACSDFSQYYCDDKNGECDNSDCSYCICKVQDRNTFVGQGSGSGKCVKDEHIEPESVPVDSFKLQSNTRHRCARQESDSSVRGNNCKGLSRGMLWIWTTWKQFMNIETLQCIEVPVWTRNKIAMRPCNINYRNQEFSCSKTDTPQNIYLTNNKRRYLRMRLRNEKFVIDVNSNKQIWRNYYESSTLLCRKTEYKGCYRFSDGSFLRFLNLSACQDDKDCLTQKISAPIYKHNTICEINWADSKYKQNEDSWTPVNDKTQFLSLVDGESSNTKGIQLNISDHDVLEKWNGLLLKLQINCSGRNWPSEQHCVLLKFASLTEAQVTKSTTPVPPVTTQKPSILSSITINPTSSQQSYFTDAKTSTSSSTIFPGSKSEMDGGSSSSIAAAISVSIVALVLILSLLGFMFYRRRKRMQERANSEETTNRDTQSGMPLARGDNRNSYPPTTDVGIQNHDAENSLVEIYEIPASPYQEPENTRVGIYEIPASPYQEPENTLVEIYEIPESHYQESENTLVETYEIPASHYQELVSNRRDSSTEHAYQGLVKL